MNKIYNSKEVLKHWNNDQVQSLEDKFLVSLEIDLIRKRLTENSKILDAGCGEGEGTFEYSKIQEIRIDAADFSDTRLKKASERLKNRNNVTLKKIDFLGEVNLEGEYDFIISQRFLINLVDWKLQRKVLLEFKKLLKKGGILLMWEGSQAGVRELNIFRKCFGLEPIAIPWHNLFFKDNQLIKFMKLNGYQLLEEVGIGEYFLLTRGIRPYFEKITTWNTKFNKYSINETIKKLLQLSTKCSRLKLWVFKR